MTAREAHEAGAGGRRAARSGRVHSCVPPGDGTLLCVLGLVSRRLLPLLQLTRMALVFTAISDSACELLLLWKRRHPVHSPQLGDAHLWKQAGVVALVSLGLYGFGMSLNDIIDRRRDRQISPHRPLPSGRIGVVTANVISALLIL